MTDGTEITFEQYQVATASTAIYPGAGTGDSRALAYVALGLAGEAGEIANKVKKILRDNNGIVTLDALNGLRKEIGDVLWYLGRLAEESTFSLGFIAVENLDKLEDRKNRGVIGGSGDER